MSIKLGNTTASLYLGSTPVAAYLGAEEVYSAVPAPPPPPPEPPEPPARSLWNVETISPVYHWSM
jgi:hypothetical protein